MESIYIQIIWAKSPFGIKLTAAIITWLLEIYILLPNDAKVYTTEANPNKKPLLAAAAEPMNNNQKNHEKIDTIAV